jgi:transketolase
MNNSQLQSSFVGLSSRDSFGQVIVELGKEHENIVALTADLTGSVKLAKFKEIFPERFFNFGIAEQNMMGAAAGLTLADKMPFVCTYAVFSSMRACEQVRTDIAYNGLPVRIVSTHGGFSFGIAGATHHAIEDIGINRVISGMTVLVPADGVETASIVRALIDLKGPAYVRLSRIKEKQVYHQDFDYKIGQPGLLREGKDILLIATGGQVGESLEAAKLLGEHHIEAGVMNISTIKPMDQEAVVRLINGYPNAMTIEEHNVMNGLGSAVAEVIALNNLDVHFKMHGLYDVFTTSGPYRDMLRYYQLDAEGICETVLKFLDE